ncbi:MAG: alpha/beta hydrolase, partial [Clostridia bacterium]|nr:alpha/beta hydrolase [Clostridia bacterium]
IVGLALLTPGLLGLGAYVVAKQTVAMALDRKAPEIMKKSLSAVSGMEKDVPLTEEVERYAELLSEKPLRTVSIKAFDGETLVGHYLPCENARRTVVAFHGWRSSWNRDFGAGSLFWTEQKCNILFVEQRGQNQSAGDYMGFGLLERYDCLSWVRWLQNSGETLPVYVAGISMGAATVLMASELLPESFVKGIMADCGYTSPNAIWKHVLKKNLRLPYTGLQAKIAAELCKRKLNGADCRFSAADALRRSKIPVLFIHGADDHFVPVEMTYENYLACTAPKELLIVPGADHGMSYYREPEKYRRAVLRFFAENDGKTKGQSSAAYTD